MNRRGVSRDVQQRTVDGGAVVTQLGLFVGDVEQVRGLEAVDAQQPYFHIGVFAGGGGQIVQFQTLPRGIRRQAGGAHDQVGITCLQTVVLKLPQGSTHQGCFAHLFVFALMGRPKAIQEVGVGFAPFGVPHDLPEGGWGLAQQVCSAINLPLAGGRPDKDAFVGLLRLRQRVNLILQHRQRVQRRHPVEPGVQGRPLFFGLRLEFVFLIGALYVM
jgi:hypothetical protein